MKRLLTKILAILLLIAIFKSILPWAKVKLFFADMIDDFGISATQSEQADGWQSASDTLHDDGINILKIPFVSKWLEKARVWADEVQREAGRGEASSTADTPPVTIPSLTVSENQQGETEQAPALEGMEGPYSVVRVVDGDTAIINIDGTEVRVRFIGIDTPESVNPDETKNTEGGKLASDYTKALLTDRKVYLTYDVVQTDDYGRTLAYLWFDSETMVNMKIINAGYALCLTIPPNVRYAEEFAQAQSDAQAEQRGLWGLNNEI